MLALCLLLTGCSEAVVPERSDAVERWVSSFARADFASCDTLVENASNRVFSPGVVSVVRDSRYYLTAMEKLVSCIRSFEISDGEVSVILVPYERVESFAVGRVDVSGYIAGDVSDSEIRKELAERYWETFIASCFIDGVEEELYVGRLSYIELDGHEYVLGTSDFIRGLLSVSNIQYNIDRFSRNVQREYSDEIRRD